MNAAILSNFSAAVESLPSTAPLEALADAALLSMSKLRDHLVVQDRNIAACRVDEAIEALQTACRDFVSEPPNPPRTIDQHIAYAKRLGGRQV